MDSGERLGDKRYNSMNDIGGELTPARKAYRLISCSYDCNLCIYEFAGSVFLEKIPRTVTINGDGPLFLHLTKLDFDQISPLSILGVTIEALGWVEIWENYLVLCLMDGCVVLFNIKDTDQVKPSELENGTGEGNPADKSTSTNVPDSNGDNVAASNKDGSKDGDGMRKSAEDKNRTSLKNDFMNSIKKGQTLDPYPGTSNRNLDGPDGGK
jgi:hypothetical protein